MIAPSLQVGRPSLIVACCASHSIGNPRQQIIELQLHRLPPVKDRLHDRWREQSEPEYLADVGLRDPLALRQILERRMHPLVNHLPPAERQRQRLDHFRGAHISPSGDTHHLRPPRSRNMSGTVTAIDEADPIEHSCGQPSAGTIAATPRAAGRLTADRRATPASRRVPGRRRPPPSHQAQARARGQRRDCRNRVPAGRRARVQRPGRRGTDGRRPRPRP